MTPVKRATYAILCLLAAAPAALAQSDRQEMLEILEPHAPAMTDAKTIHVPVYTSIRKRGARDERLLAARAPYAGRKHVECPQRLLDATQQQAWATRIEFKSGTRTTDNSSADIGRHADRLA